VITVKQSLHGMRLSQNIQTVIEYAHVVHRHVHRNVRLTCFVVLLDKCWLLLDTKLVTATEGNKLFGVVYKNMFGMA